MCDHAPGISRDRRTGRKARRNSSNRKQVEEVENKQEIVEILEEPEAKVKEEIEPLQLTQEPVDLLVWFSPSMSI